ncbi:MAG: hypothetical protein KGJ37_01130 [Verrucomicrobiota bacterium]|nr:hypothetical protein [Verrucomicrobiota bacterium]
MHSKNSKFFATAVLTVITSAFAGQAQAGSASDGGIVALRPLHAGTRPVIEPLTSIISFFAALIAPSSWEDRSGKITVAAAGHGMNRSAAPLPVAKIAQAYGPGPITPQNPDLSTKGIPPGRMTETLDVGATTIHIRQTSLQQRNVMLASLEKRILSTYAATARFQIAARQLDEKARTQFETAMQDVRAKEQAVEDSLNAARRANSETWYNARDRLAADYEAYAEAITNAENSSTSLQGNNENST